MTRVLAALALMAGLATASPALAQPLPPDVVQLTNGGMLRGTIVENLPGDHVTIQLATGELRTFPSAEVASAGPATAPPEQQVPPPPSAALGTPLTRPIVVQPGTGPTLAYGVGPTVHVHVDAGAPDLTLQQVVGTSVAVIPGGGRSYSARTVMVDNFAPLCTAPCDMELPARTYILGVSQGQGAAQRADHNLFTIDTDLSLELEYESREPVRVVGWILFIGGALAGAGVMLGAIATNPSDIVPWLIGGSVVLAVSEIVGLALAFLNDHADIRRVDGTVHF